MAKTMRKTKPRSDEDERDQAAGDEGHEMANRRLRFFGSEREAALEERARRTDERQQMLPQA